MFQFTFSRSKMSLLWVFRHFNALVDNSFLALFLSQLYPSPPLSPQNIIKMQIHIHTETLFLLLYFQDLLFVTSVGVSHLHVHLCTACMPGAQGGQKRASESLKPELQMVAECPKVFWKSSQCSQLLRHPSSLEFCFVLKGSSNSVSPQHNFYWLSSSCNSSEASSFLCVLGTFGFVV